MHQQYGPIIRVKPDMVHINDPAFLNELFPGPGRVRHKTAFFCGALPSFKGQVPFTTINHDLHRYRRGLLSSFFSKETTVRLLVPIVCDKIAKVMDILDRHKNSGAPVKVQLLFTATTNDIITEYSFGKSWDSLSSPDLNEDYFDAIHDLPKQFHLMAYHPWLFWPLLQMPQTWLTRLIPALRIMKPHMEVCCLQTKIFQTAG